MLQGANVIKKFIYILTIIIFGICLTGCVPIINNNVEDLLAAPQVTDVQLSVLKALNEHLGITATLKYPRQGDVLSPFLFSDIDGDGKEEVVVTYCISERSKNVQLALLKQKPDGSWEVTFETEGVNTDIDRIVFSHMLKGDKLQMVVGYTSLNLGDKYLVVYNCNSNSSLESIYEQGYYQFDVADMNADGLNDLVAVSSPIQLGNLQLTLVFANKDSLAHPVVKELNPRFSSCTQFGISKSLWRGRCVVLDGYISTQAIASEVLYFNGQRFEECYISDGTDIPSFTQRNYSTLRSGDIDYDGTIEVPVVDENRDGIPESSKLSWVSWYEFDQKQAYEEIFGIADLYYGYFVQLPISWKDTLYITEGSEPLHWLIRDAETKKVNVMLRLLESGEQLSETDATRYTEVLPLGNYRLYMCVLNKDVSAKTLHKGATRLS